MSLMFLYSGTLDDVYWSLSGFEMLRRFMNQEIMKIYNIMYNNKLYYNIDMITIYNIIL